MTFRLVRELAAEGVPAAVACRVLKVSESGYHAAKSRPPSRRDASDQALTSVLHEIHRCRRRLSSGRFRRWKSERLRAV